MGDAEDVGDGRTPRTGQKVLEVHFVQHPLDKGQADLEGGVDVFPAELFVHRLRVLLRDQSLAVETGDIDGFPRFDPAVGFHPVPERTALHGDDAGIRGVLRVVHDDDAMR